MDVAAASGPFISESIVPTDAAVNLTDTGTSDWAHWGNVNGSSFVHKAGGGNQISNQQRIGSTRASSASYGIPTSWSDGTPTATATATKSQLFVKDIGSGMQVTFAADTTLRTAQLLIGNYCQNTELQIDASDGSFDTVDDTSFTSTGNAIATIQYRTATPGSSITVRYTAASNACDPAEANVSLTAATLAVAALGIPAPTPPPVGAPPPPPAGTPAPPAPPPVAGNGLFPLWSSTSPWNQSLPENPAIDPNSESMIATTWANGSGRLGTARVGYTDYGFPYYVAKADDPLVNVSCFEPWGRNALCSSAGTQVRIPANAMRAEGCCDHHLTVIDAQQMRSYEMYEAPAGPFWTDQSVRVGFGNSYDLRGSGWGGPGVTASGASGLGGVVTIAEFDAALANGNASLNHALAMAPYCNNGAPSRYPAGANANQPCDTGGMGIPLGARLWWDMPDDQVDQLPLVPVAKVILKTLHHKGGFVTDTNGKSSTLDIRNAPESWTSNPAVLTWAAQHLPACCGSGSQWDLGFWDVAPSLLKAHFKVLDVSATQ